MTTHTVFVTITLADADHWPAVNAAAARLGSSAAVLQGEGPSLVTRLDELARAGCAEVLLAGVTLGEAGVPASWIGHVARWWLAGNPSRGMTVRVLTRPLREVPTADPAGESTVVRPNDTVLTNPSWEQVPAVHTQVLVCRGPRCTAKGAEGVIAALGAELHERGVLDDGVLVTQTGCLFPCNLAPVVAVQPDMAWLGPVRPGDTAAIADRLAVSRPDEVDEAFGGGARPRRRRVCAHTHPLRHSAAHAVCEP